ncbi:hypothetical protein V6Z11_D04G083700 [Gossypium hirsutum]
MTTGVVFCFLQNFQGACGTVTVDGYIKVRYISMQTQLYTKETSFFKWFGSIFEWFQKRRQIFWTIAVLQHSN